MLPDLIASAVRIRERMADAQFVVARAPSLEDRLFDVALAARRSGVPITIVDKFPKQGLHKPGSAETFYREEYVATKTIGRESYTDYGLDHDWKLVPGTWTIELWYRDRKLAEQSFTVVKP